MAEKAACSPEKCFKAVVLTLHLFFRSSELRFSGWSEIDCRHKIWTIPATRGTINKVRFSGRGAKMRSPHLVLLCRQAIAILKQIQEISGHLKLVFPGDHHPYKPMSENTTNRALRLMGYDTKTDVCGYGYGRWTVVPWWSRLSGHAIRRSAR